MELRPEFDWDRGIHLRGSVLWFDAPRQDVFTFLSSARVRESGRHKKALCNDRTRHLVRVQSPGFSPLVVPFGAALRLGPMEISLHPSGHMPGAAIMRVVSDGTIALYASHVSLVPHALAEAPQVPTGDVLVARADYGHLASRFPTRTEALGRVVEAACCTLAMGRTPVFLGSVMGKSQEVIRALSDARVLVEAHRSICEVNRGYRELGFNPGIAPQYRGSPRSGHALVLPETMRFGTAVTGLKNAKLYWLSGRSLVPEVLARMQVDEGIPLTGHLDAPGLERLVELTGVKRVVTVGHGAEEFAERIRLRGFEAQALHREVQLSMF